MRSDPPLAAAGGPSAEPLLWLLLVLALGLIAGMALMSGLLPPG